MLAAACARAASADITTTAQYGIDPTRTATVQQVDAGALALKPLEKHEAFALEGKAMWLRLDLPPRAGEQHRYVALSGGAFIDRASFFTRGTDGRWREQRAGDFVPVSQWPHPHIAPLFSADAAGPAWLRIENRPAPLSPFVKLLDEDDLQQSRQWTFLLVGGYLGFGLLVLLVGVTQGYLYGERAFHSYCTYVLMMLLFQLAYTGMGGLFVWPTSAAFNDASPALFMLLMTAAGIWNIRESVALQRHSPLVDRLTIGFCIFGVLFAAVYTAFTSAWSYAVLMIYGLAAVVLSITLCLWTWRRGERWSLWIFLGFLPIHLAYPFPALRASGVLPDSWASQYAVLIGSAIEIPLLLFILHWRAREFSENRARLRALDSTDPLTGLAVVPVLRLRLRDSLRRARRLDHPAALLLVEVANHAEIVAREGREAGDRALVVAAGRLSRLVREIDTVCRISNTRFAILVEGPQPDEARRALAPHMVARGLEPLPHMPNDLALRLKVVTLPVPDTSAHTTVDGSADEQRLLERANEALDLFLGDPKRAVYHLGRVDEPATAPSVFDSEPLRALKGR
nr:7TM diverse intracellular signaling domain-containing protein [Ramlibacter albus]